MYDSSEFWDKRYSRMMAAGIPPQEWYGLDDRILAHIKDMASSENICGQSCLCERLRVAGFKNLSACDFSEVLIKARIAEEKKRSSIAGAKAVRIKYIQCDLRAVPPMPKDSVDLVVDKATFDSIVYRRTSAAKEDAQGVWRQVERMLKTDGQFLSISLNNDDIWKKYVSPGDNFVPVTKTEKIVQGDSRTARNVYVRKFKLKKKS
eukprot:CAMPEP_0167765490 /NCGR_PEP_ID=MMETSP0110_2-20121227/14722_1 /TAXON_ID=629695 /ORGANISM="Gymnochlora sp., Strain CCMP2014" /LENGTH=205 /DNA_ID=CAMNT_0007653221 /DNA_START=47 /DNA_END=664 /DNA_ORIENTATION=-